MCVCDKVGYPCAYVHVCMYMNRDSATKFNSQSIILQSTYLVLAI